MIYQILFLIVAIVLCVLVQFLARYLVTKFFTKYYLYKKLNDLAYDMHRINYASSLLEEKERAKYIKKYSNVIREYYSYYIEF